jgi:hypothetical protein
MVEHTSYYALRRCPGAAADAWWVIASQRRDMPAAIQALLTGRGRVEVSYEETVESLAWAERIDGWTESGDPPLRVHPHDPRFSGR